MKCFMLQRERRACARRVPSNPLNNLSRTSTTPSPHCATRHTPVGVTCDVTAYMTASAITASQRTIHSTRATWEGHRTRALADEPERVDHAESHRKLRCQQHANTARTTASTCVWWFGIHWRTVGRCAPTSVGTPTVSTHPVAVVALGSIHRNRSTPPCNRSRRNHSPVTKGARTAQAQAQAHAQA